jgi:pyruvate,water dikinase
LHLGRFLVRDGHLLDPQEIFFLTDREIRQFASGSPDVRERVALRRARWHGWRGQDTPSHAAPAHSGGLRLQGIAVSPGLVTGPARVVRSLAESQTLRAGSILILPNADPAWTPLFLQAAAVVCDAGGFLSHSATVVREFGIPAVFNTGEATRRIQDGQSITVNAHEGWVEC